MEVSYKNWNRELEKLDLVSIAHDIYSFIYLKYPLLVNPTKSPFMAILITTRKE